MFIEKFDDYVCAEEFISVEKDGFRVTARIVFDEDSHIDDDDCHNVDQAVTGCNDEQQAKLLENRQAWSDDEWFYCGIVLSVFKNGIELNDHAASLWSVDANYPGGDNSYLTEVANDLLPEALEEGKRILATLLES